MVTPKNRFRGRIKTIESLRSKQIKLKNKGLITQRDLDRLYEASFLMVFNAFEYFVEEQFFCLLMGKQYCNRRVRPLIQVNSLKTARQVVFDGKSYKKFLPLNNLKDISSIYFYKGYPFVDFSLTDSQNVMICKNTRNLIAHGSQSAKKTFITKVVASTSVGNSVSTAAAFLQHRHSGTQNFYESLTSRLIDISNKLSN